jgi:hypothetical protein
MKWKYLKALNELYHDRKTKIKIDDIKDDEGKFFKRVLIGIGRDFVIQKKLGGLKTGIWIPNDNFDEFYEKKYNNTFEKYQQFFIINNIPHSAIQNYEEEEIKILIDLKHQLDNGDLDEIAKQIEEQGGESLHGVSLMFTKDEKYLDYGKDSFKNALKIILQTKLPTFDYLNHKDQQYMYKLMHTEPICIVLCENLDFLRKPLKPRENRIELWYAGGRNIAKLGYEPPRKVPIFYSCDWDWDGLDIFKSVKEKLPEIKLLNPKSSPINRKETPNHNSEWKNSNSEIELVQLDKSLFDDIQRRQILHLEKTNSWIREEENYNYLVEMVNEAMAKI